MNILVTGHRGFIGAHLVDVLKQAGHHVTGVDLDLFEGCEFEPPVTPDTVWKKDVRALQTADLEGFDRIMHLAALSNDPMGDLNPELTLDINYRASVELARKAKAASVPRFLFSGSCSVYGKGETLDLDESASMNPHTAYAESKIETEKEVSKLADDTFCPTFLRNATAYGYSPMLRIDLVVNNLLACAVTTGEIRIRSDGTPWRPLIHCRDIARAFVALMDAPRDKVYNLPINIGGTEENYQVKDVAQAVQDLLPKAKVVFTGETGKDPRDYRVNFDRLNTLLPDFKLAYNMAQGMEELYQKFLKHSFSLDDFQGDRYVRLRTLKDRMDRLGL